MALCLGGIIFSKETKKSPVQQAHDQLPILMREFRPVTEPEGGFVIMDYPKHWGGGIYYVSVCRYADVAAHLNADGSLTDDFRAIRLNSERIALMTAAGTPFGKGTRVKVQMVHFAWRYDAMGATPANATICMIVEQETPEKTEEK
jgi:hypothetical protein